MVKIQDDGEHRIEDHINNGARAPPEIIDDACRSTKSRLLPEIMDDNEAVRSVWADNMEAESSLFHEVAPHATHVALNVQYPGCVVHGDGRKSHYDQTTEERYQVVRANVARLKPLQVGLAIRTRNGKRYSWEFNLNGFDVALENDERDPDSIAYLARCGVDFNRLPWSGIDGSRLCWLLWSSGLFRTGAEWTTFAGAYHVAYFVTIISGERLPGDVNSFVNMVCRFLGPSVYDVKRLAREHDNKCVGALSKIVKQLVVVQPDDEGDRLPESSTPAGMGSTLALLAFETLKLKLGANKDRYRGQLCGLQVV